MINSVHLFTVDVGTGGGNGTNPTPIKITSLTTTEIKTITTKRKQNITESSTLLLVAGGYSRYSGSDQGGPINDIELISGENNTACSKSVTPILGKKLKYFFGETSYEGDALGMTGQFTKGAAIICGGKNTLDNLNACYEYNHTQNE